MFFSADIGSEINWSTSIMRENVRECIGIKNIPYFLIKQNTILLLSLSVNDVTHSRRIAQHNCTTMATSHLIEYDILYKT